MELVINILMADCIIVKFIPDFLGGLHKHTSYRDRNAHLQQECHNSKFGIF